jgi:hypothetical protein
MWIIVAWQYTSPKVTVNSFKKRCMSNGSDDDMLWNDSEEEGDVRRKCEEDEGNDCEDGDSVTDW